MATISSTLTSAPIAAPVASSFVKGTLLPLALKVAASSLPYFAQANFWLGVYFLYCPFFAHSCFLFFKLIRPNNHPIITSGLTLADPIFRSPHRKDFLILGAISIFSSFAILFFQDFLPKIIASHTTLLYVVPGACGGLQFALTIYLVYRFVKMWPFFVEFWNAGFGLERRASEINHAYFIHEMNVSGGPRGDPNHPIIST